MEIKGKPSILGLHGLLSCEKPLTGARKTLSREKPFFRCQEKGVLRVVETPTDREANPYSPREHKDQCPTREARVLLNPQGGPFQHTPQKNLESSRIGGFRLASL